MTVKVFVKGYTAPGFQRVRKAFERNFYEHGELGAAFAVYWKGEKAIDIWAGSADKENSRPWEEDTVAVVYSTTKGMSAMAVAVAHSRGLFDYDQPVAKYWPEFAQNGKEKITVRQLLNHQAGLSAIDEKLDFDDLADSDRVTAAIARQKPLWEPGTRHGYHGLTLGWYESALIRATDPQKRTVGQYFRDEIAVPLGLDFHIGLPDDFPRERIATIDGYEPWQLLFNLHKMPPKFVLGMLNPFSITSRSFSNPAILGKVNSYNEERMQRIELPAANGIGTARSIAKAYGEFATGGKTLGLTQETFDALRQPADPPRDGLYDLVIRTETSFSLGFLKPFPDSQFGRNEESFGTPGAGGSLGFADPVEQIGYAYIMNRSGFYLLDDPRELALRKALYECLDEMA